MKIAALADLHVTSQSQNVYKDFFNKIGEHADVVVMCGDLTDTGKIEEARMLARDMAGCKIPILGVLGNHDYEQNEVTQIKEELAKNTPCSILDGDGVVVSEVGFCGTKGFGGGFDELMLSSWGEPATKAFVEESVREALRLDSALARLNTKQTVVLMHYAPIVETVRGEPEAIFPFLGCSRFVEPIDHRGVNVVFHGHAHKGAAKGNTKGGVPVFNVTLNNLNTDQGVKYFLYELSE